MLNAKQRQEMLLDEATDAIQKIQGLGYTFTFDIPTQTYEACLENPDGTFETIHRFANLLEAITWVKENIE